jgi:hypothetical protein
MGLFDRLFASRSGNASSGTTPAQPKKEAETFFLDPDASSSMGNVDFMRRSNTIRRTFPGTADSPGNKEMVAEVASMEAKIEKMSEGLAGITPQQESIDLTGGIPKPVKKTFAQTMSQAELDQRKKGSAVGVNVPGGPAAIKMEKEQAASQPASQPQISQQPSGKPGAIDPFKQMVKELNG